MAKLTKTEVKALAAGLEAPRVIVRKELDGSLRFVLRFGPPEARQETVFDRSLSRGEALEAINMPAMLAEQASAELEAKAIRDKADRQAKAPKA